MNQTAIKVLIVDDDTIVRRGLRATVNWEKYGMTVVAEAPNGKRGWEEFLNFQPEVVITDIVMPEENGLELSRKIKNHSMNTKILLLSCHKDFEYAQEGLKLGASGYLLKTVFDDEELDHFLSSFQKEIIGAAKENVTDIQAFHESFLLWLSGYKNDFEQRLDQLFHNEWSWMKQPFYAFFIQNLPSLNKEIDSQNSNFVPLSFGSNLMFFFVEESFYQKFLTYLTELRVGQPDLNWIYTGPLSGKQDWMKSVMAFHHVQQQDERLHQYPPILLQAVEYIVRNLSKPMTVSHIAEAVGMSRSHLSTLFKKSIGDSIHSFIEKKRLQLAKQLLKGSTLNIQEISEQIGILDAKYFSKWFKRCMGFPPSYYRTQQKDEKIRTE
ncbi:response regulator transcription factor [Heyndrickxia sp. NPDC080065]|uniref:response regulator transcription factor n=1 Tax=Heyndrickxia sp. NPDC080065 TaxID=3390568 RepID=UPI003D07F80C